MNAINLIEILRISNDEKEAKSKIETPLKKVSDQNELRTILIDSENNESVLHWAIEKEYIEIALLILEAATKQNLLEEVLRFKDSIGNTPMNAAILGDKNAELVQLMINKAPFDILANILTQGNDAGTTPLLGIIVNNRKETFEPLVQKANAARKLDTLLSLEAQKGKTLAQTAHDEDANEVEAYLNQLNEELHTNTEEMSAKLKKALEANNQHDATTALKAGAKFDNETFSTIVKKGWKQAVDHVVELTKLDKFDLNPQGYDFVSDAFKAGHTKITLILMQNGAKTTFTFQQLFDAVKIGEIEVFDMILSQHPEFLREKDEGGNTIIHALTSPQSKPDLFKDKIKDLDINAKNNNGDTPLHLSVCKDYYNIFSRVSSFSLKPKSTSTSDSTAVAIPIQEYNHNDIKNTGVAHAKIFATQSEVDSFIGMYGYAVIKNDGSKNEKALQPLAKPSTHAPSLHNLFGSFISEEDSKPGYKLVYELREEHSSGPLGYSFLGIRSQSYYDKTDKPLPSKTIECLLESGANQYITNNQGLTPRNIVETFCPKFLNEFDALVERMHDQQHNEL